jgi:very-short-patch-repair endonuclease
LGPFVVDFLCPEKMFIIEVDGGQHAENTEMDERRSLVLQAMGYQIMRFWNNEVLQETEGVLTRILTELTNG